MFDLNRELNTTLILVTHDIHFARRCDESITLSGGKIIAKNETKLEEEQGACHV